MSEELKLTKEQAAELCDALELNSEFFDEENEEYILLSEHNPNLLDAYILPSNVDKGRVSILNYPKFPFKTDS